MRIKVRLGNVLEAIKQVEEFRKRFHEKRKLFLQRLAEIGVAEAETRFRTAQYDGTNDVKVEEPIWVDDNRVIVKASGSSILFIEFGSGVHYAAQSHPQATEFGYERGGYGQGRGKNDFWYYQGEPGTNGQPPKDERLREKGLVYTHGNPANRCMWEAGKKIRSEILKIAKEVFGSD